MKTPSSLLPALAALVPLLFVSSAARADEGARPAESAASEPSPPPPKPKPWGVEVELVQPFIPEVHIFSAKATRTLWGAGRGLRGEAVVGVYLRPGVGHDVVEEIDEYTGILGYRQYVWRGLHAEALTYLGWAGGRNNRKNGRDYSDFAWLAEASAGYRFTVLEGSALAMHVTPQAGYLVGVYTNIGPRDTPDRFVTAKLLVGVQF